MTYRTRNLAIAVGLTLVAMMLTLLYVSNYKRSVESSVANVKVYVAARDVQAGTPGSELLSGDGVKLAEVPRKNVVPGAISEPDQIRNLVLAGSLYSGEQVTMRRFTDIAAEGVRSQLKGTMRALQVSGDGNQLLDGTLAAGDRVDVVANIRINPDKDVRATRMVLRDIPVLAIGEDGAAAPGVADGEHSVILAVTDVQSLRLFYVMRNADWSLQLRPVVDPSDSPETLETMASMTSRGVK